MIAKTTEIDAIKKRYERRRSTDYANRYSPLDPYVLMVDQEIDRTVVRLLKQTGLADRIAQRSLLEIGCGNGNNLLRFLRCGFRPDTMVGNELLPERLKSARSILPLSIRLVPGDAAALDLADATFDVVCLFTVFSSILDDDFQARLADKAWSLVKPGGGVLWYDFVYNNPSNRDVRGVSIRRLRQLFPYANARIQRVTLAPPIGRPTTRLWVGSYTLLNRLPLLRSHVLAWLSKQ